jgi:hypothetical protein
MRVIIGRGRTVLIPCGTKPPEIYIAGEVVTLPDDEAQRLIALGTVNRPGEQPRIAGIPEPEARANGTHEGRYSPGPAVR